MTRHWDYKHKKREGSSPLVSPSLSRAHRHVRGKFQPRVLAAETHGILEGVTVEKGMINSTEKGKLEKFPRKRESRWGTEVGVRVRQLEIKEGGF